MDVRLATVDDADGIAKVHVETWQQSYRGLVPDDYLDALAIEQREQFWRRELAHSDPERPVWVGLVDGQVVGFAGVGPSRDDDADETVGELYAIYVLPDHQGRGVGQALIGVAGEWLGGRFDGATLWVLEPNQRSRDFYERSGWRFDGALKSDDRGSFVLSEARHRIGFRESASK